MDLSNLADTAKDKIADIKDNVSAAMNSDKAKQIKDKARDIAGNVLEKSADALNDLAVKARAGANKVVE